MEPGVLGYHVHVRLPGCNSASLSMNEARCIGISCISQVQLPWGRLPGIGQVFPEYSHYKKLCLVAEIVMPVR